MAEDSARVPPTPAPTPSTAISSGSPAATRVPSMISSTAAATARPMTSAAPKSEERSCRISLEKSTSTPAASGPAAMDLMSARCAVVSASVEPLKVTCATAVDPSREMKRMPSEAPAWRAAKASSASPVARSLAPCSSLASASGICAAFSSRVFCPATSFAWFSSMVFCPAASLAALASISAWPGAKLRLPVGDLGRRGIQLGPAGGKFLGPGVELGLGGGQLGGAGLEFLLLGVERLLPGGEFLVAGVQLRLGGVQLLEAGRGGGDAVQRAGGLRLADLGLFLFGFEGRQVAAEQVVLLLGGRLVLGCGGVVVEHLLGLGDAGLGLFDERGELGDAGLGAGQSGLRPAPCPGPAASRSPHGTGPAGCAATRRRVLLRPVASSLALASSFAWPAASALRPSAIFAAPARYSRLPESHCFCPASNLACPSFSAAAPLSSSVRAASILACPAASCRRPSASWVLASPSLMRPESSSDCALLEGELAVGQLLFSVGQLLGGIIELGPALVELGLGVVELLLQFEGLADLGDLGLGRPGRRGNR